MTREEQRYGRDKETVVNRTYIESGEFRRKFDSIVDDPKIARILYSLAKEMLFHRSGTRIEDMYWIDGVTGEIVASVTDQTEETEQHIVYSDSIKKILEKRENLISLHTHPASMPPSPDDFNAYYQNGYMISLVICHDGTIYQYKSDQRFSEELFALRVSKYIQMGYSEKEAQISALNAIKRSYNIDFWEVI